MSSLTASARPQGDTRQRPLPWRRMAWVIWRQHRFALTSLVASLGTLGLALWLVGVHLHHVYGAAAACRPAGSSVCAGLANTFGDTDRLLADGYLLQVVPALVGAFLGAPLLARELETGTFRYAWTQGFGRSRWTVAKLVALAAVVAVAVGAFGLLLSWYYHPYFATGAGNLSFYEMSPLAGGVFDLRGIALPAWTMAAFAIGCLAGVLIRRIVPAIIATLAAYTGLALATGLFLRQRYMTPLVTSHLQLVEGPKITPLGTNWILSQGYAKAGRPVGQSAVERLLRAAPTGNPEKGFDPTQYLLQHGYTVLTRYQPASRFWAFQWIEAGWLVALSLLLLAATLWLVHRRAA
jgi:hypothetical protein